MSIVNCLLNVDDINYRITMRLTGNRENANLDDLMNAIVVNSDLKEYDFTQGYFVFEIYDKDMCEWVRIEDNTIIEDMSKARVKILDPDEIAKNPEAKKTDSEDVLFSALAEDKNDGEILELFIEKHVPKASLIAKVDSPNVTEATFTVNNLRMKRDFVKFMLAVQHNLFECPNHRLVWEEISDQFKTMVVGYKILKLLRERKDLGFVQYTPMMLEKEFNALIGQYNRLLRTSSNLSFTEACEMWPFFKWFHRHFKLEKIYPSRAPSLQIMKNEFDNAFKGKNI